MKRLAISIIFCIFCAKAHATTPFAPKVFVNDNWTFVAGFAWPDQNDKVLIIRTLQKTSLFSLEELGIKIEIMTTAGSQWYQNSIGYITSLSVKGTDSETRLRVFYFRHRDGSVSVVDLKSNKLIDPETIIDKEALKKRTASNAASLLRSDRPHDRQTAAIHLGQLKAKEHLQELKNLLKDDASYTESSGKKTRTVYYVKEAAEKAIQLINSK